MSRMDITLPYGRPVAKSLLSDPVASQVAQSDAIDKVLDVLSGTKHAEVESVEPPKALASSSSAPIIPPPHPFIADDGAVNVTFEEGNPIPLPAEHIKPSHAEISAPPTPATAADHGDLASILETMKSLQTKYNLGPKPSTSSSSSSSSSKPSAVKQETRKPSEALSAVAERTESSSSSAGGSEAKKKKSVEWNLPEKVVGSSPSPVIAVGSNSGPGSTTSRPQGKRPVGLEVKERSNPQTMSIRAMATKKEPSPLAFIHRFNEAIYQARGLPVEGGVSAPGIAFTAEETAASYGSIEGYSPHISNP